MRLQSITELNQEQQEQMSKIWAGVKSRLYGPDKPARTEIFKEFHCDHGYGHALYRGRLNDGIEITELELSMVCDNGFSYFGGSSVIWPDRRFSVKIYTD